MSLNEMEASHDFSCETDRKPGFKISRCEPTKICKNSSHTVRLFEVFQSLRKYVKGVYGILNVNVTFLFLETTFYVMLG